MNAREREENFRLRRDELLREFIDQGTRDWKGEEDVTRFVEAFRRDEEEEKGGGDA